MLAGLRDMDSGVVSIWRTVYSTTFATFSFGWNGFNLRNVIGASDLLFSGSAVRVTLQGWPTGTGFVIDHAEVGHASVVGGADAYDFDGGQVPLTFSGGSAGCTVASGGSIVTDAVTFALDKTKNLIIALHFSDLSDIASFTYLSGTTRGYFKSAASEVSVSDVTGYTPGNVYIVGLIEAFS